MSGWIKLSKELPESIRFRRVVRSVRERNALPGVTDRDATLVKTLCVGALVRLWIYADSHIDNNNRIAATFDEIDEIVGVPGFAASMPADWLVKVDDETVELPDFLEHNGSSAKQRRDNAARQARWRENHKANGVTRHVTVRNASNAARPDQTRPDHKEEIHVVFDHWKATHGHQKAKLDTKREKLIREAMKLYGPEDLKRCIDGYKRSKWHQGQNENKRVYDDIELFLRDAKHIDAGLKLADGGVIEWM